MKDHKVLIAVPALDMMPTLTAYNMLTMKRDCPSRFSFIVRASCHDARNLLAREAIESGADRVLWMVKKGKIRYERYEIEKKEEKPWSEDE